MLKLHGWFLIHSFEIVMWVVHSDINCNLFFSQLDFFGFIFDLLDVKVENSHSPHVKDDRKVKIFIGPPPFEGRLRMAFVWAQQVPRSCSISNVQILNFTGCHSLVALTNLDNERCSSSCRFSKTWYLFVCVHTSLFYNEGICFLYLQTQIKSLFQHIWHHKCVSFPAGKEKYTVSHTRASGEEKCNPIVSK